jgi:2-C-methyl-D-erythritol 2,4-cyclodiphosphate synthase
MTGLRIGHGYDAHRFAAGRPLILGGVRIEHSQGLAGHSDADALCHAVTDALLGAMALGDMGRHFPSSDEAWRDADSVEMLREAVRRVREAGGTPVQVDCTVYLEAPRLAPHVEAMRSRLAEALAVDAACVSVKATTTDGLGFVGRGEGAAASAVALVATGGQR